MTSEACRLRGFSNSSNEGMKPSHPIESRVKKRKMKSHRPPKASHMVLTYLGFPFFCCFAMVVYFMLLYSMRSPMFLRPATALSRMPLVTAKR